jgi:hypothetical protein
MVHSSMLSNFRATFARLGDWLGGWDVGCYLKIAGWCESGNRGSKYLQSTYSDK